MLDVFFYFLLFIFSFTISVSVFIPRGRALVKIGFYQNFGNWFDSKKVYKEKLEKMNQEYEENYPYCADEDEEYSYLNEGDFTSTLPYNDDLIGEKSLFIYRHHYHSALSHLEKIDTKGE